MKHPLYSAEYSGTRSCQTPLIFRKKFRNNVERLTLTNRQRKTKKYDGSLTNAHGHAYCRKARRYVRTGITVPRGPRNPTQYRFTGGPTHAVPLLATVTTRCLTLSPAEGRAYSTPHAPTVSPQSSDHHHTQRLPPRARAPPRPGPQEANAPSKVRLHQASKVYIHSTTAHRPRSVL